MKKFLILCMTATLLMAGSAKAGNISHLLVQPNMTTPAPVERTAHLITIKNMFGWTDAAEAQEAKPAEGRDSVKVGVTNCKGFGPLPDPLSLTFGQSKAFEGNVDPKTRPESHGLFGAQCTDTAIYQTFAVTNLTVSDGDAKLYTRAEYTTSIGKDLFDILELPDALTYANCSPPATCSAWYEFSRAWNGGPDNRSSFVAFVNVGPEGNVRVTAIDDTTGATTSGTVFLRKGDTFIRLPVSLAFGRVRMTIPPPSIGCGGCTPESLTPKIYAVIFRGHEGAGVAKAIVPTLSFSTAIP
jgi:hypothetical protein